MPRPWILWWATWRAGATPGRWWWQTTAARTEPPAWWKPLPGENPNVRLVKLSHRGKGWAVKWGMLEAQGQYRFIADADLSMPIEHLERFLPPALSDFDIAIGSREAPGSRRFHEPFAAI